MAFCNALQDQEYHNLVAPPAGSAVVERLVVVANVRIGPGAAIFDREIFPPLSTRFRTWRSGWLGTIRHKINTSSLRYPKVISRLSSTFEGKDL
jgi:hypothetical protein